MKRTDTEVLVVGGGLVGATLASLLGSRGVECTIIEAGAKPETARTFDPRALALTIASANILKGLGLWDRLPEDRIGYFRRMQVWDENGNGRIAFDCTDLHQSTLGYIVEQSVLQNTLDDALKYFPAVSVIRGETIMALEWQPDYTRVILSDSKPVKTRLVVAADGFSSMTRDLAGIDYLIHDYQQSAIASVVMTEYPHEDVARQRFLTNGPLAFLPMSDGNQCGIVWSTLPGHARQLVEMTEPEFNIALQEAFDNELGRIIDSGPRAVFPLKRARAARYCSDRVVLVGDAAHSIHPLAGQGANLGLLDAACLAQVLLEAKVNKKDIGSRLVLRK